MKLNYQMRLTVLVTVQILILLGIVFVAYRPSLSEIDRVEGELAEMAAKQADLCAVLEEKPQPEADIARLQAEIRKIEQRIPPESRVSWLSARIAHAMEAHNVDLRSATRWSDGGQHPAVPQLKRLRKSVSVRCSARDLQEFLVAVNRLPFVVVVDDLMVNRDREWGAVSARIELVTFVLRATKADSELTTATFGDHPVE